MRTILFKGKRADFKDWITGHYSVFMSDKESHCIKYEGLWYTIIPSTLSQLVGLTNHVSMWEGDLYKYQDQLWTLEYNPIYGAFVWECPANSDVITDIMEVLVGGESLGNRWDNESTINTYLTF